MKDWYSMERAVERIPASLTRNEGGFNHIHRDDVIALVKAAGMVADVTERTSDEEVRRRLDDLLRIMEAPARVKTLINEGRQ